jgi:hypothetical protein
MAIDQAGKALWVIQENKSCKYIVYRLNSQTTEKTDRRINEI